MPPAARSRIDSTTTTTALLRALVSLSSRLHEPHASADPGALYAMVCATLRECRLHAHIAELDAGGTLRVVGTTIGPPMQALIERLIGAPFIGYPIAREGPYAEALASSDAVVIDRVVDILAPIMPRLAREQREQLAQRVAAERAARADPRERADARRAYALGIAGASEP